MTVTRGVVLLVMFAMGTATVSSVLVSTAVQEASGWTQAPLSFPVYTLDRQTVQAETRIAYSGRKWCAEVFFQEAVRKAGSTMNSWTLIKQSQEAGSEFRQRVAREFVLYINSPQQCRTTYVAFNFELMKFAITGFLPPPRVTAEAK